MGASPLLHSVKTLCNNSSKDFQLFVIHLNFITTLLQNYDYIILEGFILKH